MQIIGLNFLTDETFSLSGHQLEGALGEMGESLATSGAHAASCVGIVADNSVRIALVIWYLLHHRINFFLLSRHSSSNPSFPGFCDLIIHDTKRQGGNYGSPDIFDGPQALTCETNPDYTHGENELRPGSGAVILASSGSTGQAKFIRYRADRLLANAAACVRRFGLSENSNVLVPVPMGHMFGLGVGLLPALLAGSKLCLIDRANVIRIADRLSGFQPDLTLATPTIIKMLLLLKRKPEKKGLFISAGEKLQPKDYIRFESQYGPLVNLYGCTEMGAIATTDLTDLPDHRAQGQVKPLPGVELEISLEKMILCRHPAAFDYYIDPRGHQVTRNQDNKNNYPTGDLGVSPSVNRFLVLGRADHCVNRCGFLVSLEEIEYRLTDLFTQVEQVVVLVAAEDTLRGPGLVAICQLKKGGVLTKESAKATCADTMAGHWIPDEFHFVPDLPRLPNGKPDRVSLQQMYLSLIHKQS